MSEIEAGRKKKIAHAVKRIRDKMGLTQMGLARHLGLTTTAVYNYESGRRTPKAKTVLMYLELAKKHKLAITGDDFIE